MGDWRRVNWSKQPLGIKSDTEIARRLGVTRNRVAKARKERGIECSPRSKIYAHKGIDWDRQPIGEEPDNAIAKRLGVSSVTVLNARRRRDIPAFVPEKTKAREKVRKPDIDWDGQPLGVQSDRAIARHMNTPIGSVRRARVARGIEPAPHARKFTKKGIDWDKQPLGKQTDTVIAAGLGCDPNSVRSARRRRGIPSVRERALEQAQPGVPLPPDGRRHTDWDKEPLGKMPDKDLALMLGLTSSAVAKARHVRDIPPYHEAPGVSWSNS